MESQELYDLVYEAARAAVEDTSGVPDARMVRRFEDGKLVVMDGFGKTAKELPIGHLMKKVTSVRDKLRVLEQKINANGGLQPADKAEFQGYITKAYGSLTTFNFLFADEADRFRGTGG